MSLPCGTCGQSRYNQDQAAIKLKSVRRRTKVVACRAVILATTKVLYSSFSLRGVVKPIVQAMILADAVFQDRFTGKWIISGTFNVLTLRLFQPPQAAAPAGEPSPSEQSPTSAANEPPIIPLGPTPGHIPHLFQGSRAGSPYVYLSLTEMPAGEVKLELRYVDLNDLKVMFQVMCNLPITGNDPLKVYELRVPLPLLPEIPGKYALELLYKDELLGQNRVEVVAISG